MKLQWHKLLLKLTIWLALEIVLNLMGLDDVADYGEFILTNSNTCTTSVNVCIK
ncbi:MAG: hypothetical protein QNJ60_03335 [Xenococcaceae cyanobacterium MO_188.B19]|nr:hypothetical protein [Xenococcaceae cyanobacterium MO_188.B19]